MVTEPAAVSVPPEILVVAPAPPTAGWNQVVIKVNTVADADAWVRIYSPVYGEAALVSWKRLVVAPLN